jgi:hypothetical protein
VTFLIDEDDYLAHYGILRRSGRYPWGSGGPETNAGPHSFLAYVDGLRKQGLSEKEVAAAVGSTVAELRAAKSIANAQKKQADIAQAQRLKDHGLSNVAIGQRMGIPESSVRALLAPGQLDKAQVLDATSGMLKAAVAKDKYVDVGTGVEHHLGVSDTKLKTAVAKLREEGYELHYVKVPQLGTGKFTSTKVLVSPGTPYSETYAHRGDIKLPVSYSTDGGHHYNDIQPPLSISSKRVAVRYGNEGGAEADGVIYVRPGVSDLSLGANRYAQVRIAVDGTHFLKGMAMYKDDLPAGVDLVFNTNKNNTGNKLDAMKSLKDDPELPFGSVVRQITGKNGKPSSVMNIVNDEGDWTRWSRSLSSQFLSKQSPALAKQQLDMSVERRKNEFDSIMALTNPEVRRKLLLEFADGADSASTQLKAAHLPRQQTHVILPIASMKENEVYAPNYRDGESVVLVRFPHGGTFEIPELKVNNRNAEAKKAIGTGTNSIAIGINSKVAQRLSGADFDGDTVLVIPNGRGSIKTSKPLKDLEGFDPQKYKLPDDSPIPRMTARVKGMQMGLVSNLITDMTLQGAPPAELARAVRHSMVVIDAEKHHLNYQQSAIDNGIPQLMLKYQGRKGGGASTLISRRKSTVNVPERKDSFSIDPTTGEKIYKTTGASYVDKATGKTVVRTSKVNKLAETSDAHTLVSANGGTPIERVYADYSNRMKALANQARREAVNTKSTLYSPTAKTAYAKEVASLSAKLQLAQRNAPLERQAQVVANAAVRAKIALHPDLEASTLKKIKYQELERARQRLNPGGKTKIDITEDEWKAIQAGAISPSRLRKILDDANIDTVREHATPRAKVLMTSTKLSRARAMLDSGYTQADVADALGVSLTTLKTSLSG